MTETFKHVIPSGKGKPAVFYHSDNDPEYARQETLKLQQAYRQKDAEAINHYTNWKL